MEGVAMVRLNVGKKSLEIFLCLLLKNRAIRRPDTIGELKSMNSIFFPPDNGLSMKERVVSVPKFNPFFSGFLVPKHFFLKENVIVFSLQFFFKKNMIKGIHSLQIIMNAL